ncbi:hypothetical protein [Streptomyces sp. NPDC005476]|uniref:hypothetical protein n=1 Tax=Streptomyces sp. NPDC005476 TaxID=3156882 RepID=UPI003456E689
MTTADPAGIGKKDIDDQVIHHQVGTGGRAGEGRAVREGGDIDERGKRGRSGDSGVGAERGDRGDRGDRGGRDERDAATRHEVMIDTGAARGMRVSATHLRVLVAASGWLALAATAVPGPSPLRWVPVLLFVLFGPGCAALYPQPGGLASGARLEAVALAAPISLSLGVLTATSLFLVKSFSMTAFLVSLACFTTVTAALPGLPLPAARRGAVERAKVRRRPSGDSDT